MLEKFLKLIGRDVETLIEQRKEFVKTTEFKEKVLEEQKEVERRYYLKVVKKARKFILYCLKLRSRNFLFHKKVITEIRVDSQFHFYKLRYIDIDGQSKRILRYLKMNQYFICGENPKILYDAFKEVFQEMKDLVDGDVKIVPWGSNRFSLHLEIVLKF